MFSDAPLCEKHAEMAVELSINHRTLIVSYFLHAFSHCYSVIQSISATP